MDWPDDEETRAFLEQARTDALPKITESVATVSIYSGETDPKIAVELGYTLLLDKPLIIVVTAGVTVPEHLVRAADEIVEWGEPAVMQQRINDALSRVLEERGE